MNFIKQITLTPSEANNLEHLGFSLKLVKVLGWSKDLYNVFVVGE